MQVLVYICEKKCKVMLGRDQLAMTSSKNFGTYQSFETDWISIYAMVMCRSHDPAGSLVHGVIISKPTGNPDPLAKSRPTSKIQTHWLVHKVVHIVTRNIQKLKSSFHQYFI